MNKSTRKLVKDIPGWLSTTEGLFLEHAAKKTDRLQGAIVEIGSFNGKSTIWLAQAKGIVYAIDPHRGVIDEREKHPNTYKSFIRNIKKARVFDKIVPLIVSSQKAAENWDKQIRMLFIDGLHDEKNATLDFELWSKHVTKNGIVAVHDAFLRWCGSEKVAVAKIVKSSDFYKIGVVGSIVYGIKGRGNVLHRLTKLIWQIYIIGMVNLNHLKIIVLNFPSVLKTRISLNKN